MIQNFHREAQALAKSAPMVHMVLTLGTWRMNERKGLGLIIPQQFQTATATRQLVAGESIE